MPKGPQGQKRPAEDLRTQAEKFGDLARELECDDDGTAFGERLKKLATAPREPPKANAGDD